MHATLQTMERRVAPPGPCQVVVRAVLHQAAALDGDDAISPANWRKTVRDIEDGPVLSDLAHVLLNDALALVIERAGRLIEDQDAWIGDERPRDRDPLALPARETAAALADDGVGQPFPGGPVSPCPEPEFLGAAEHLRDADRGCPEPVPDLLGIGRDTMEAP